jgi:YbbR domain-containing protein
VKLNFSQLGKFFKHLQTTRYKKDLGIFLIFLLISTIFWFLNQLEDQYVTRIFYPIKYTDYPDDKVLVGEIPSKLELEVEGQGFELLEYKVDNLSPLLLQISTYDLKSQGEGNSLLYYIAAENIKPRIAQQLSSNMKIIDISPDTLFFEFANRIKKRVPVEPNIRYSFGRQMMLKEDISIEPDSIEVSGPESVLDTVEAVRTQFRNYSDLTSDVTATLQLEKLHNQVEFSTPRVRLKIPVEQYTEGTLKKDIVVRNSPDSVVLRIFPSTVNITYLVGLSNYEEVIPELFKVYVDYRDTWADRDQLRVYVEKAPEYLKSYTFRPQEVDYIIEKKHD